MKKNITLASVIRALKEKWPDMEIEEQEKFADRIDRLGIENFKDNVKDNCAPEFPCAHRNLGDSDRVSNYDEIVRLKRSAGLILTIIDMIETRNKNCRNLVDQISSVRSILKEIGKHILLRHIEICTKEKDWPGENEAARKRELDLTFKKFGKYFDSGDLFPRAR